MGSKEPEPWSPRWVGQKLRKKNNDLPPNHDKKSPAVVERPLWKCDLDCQSHMSWDHDMYGRRYWSFPHPTCPFHWHWDKEKPRKVVWVLTFILHILNKVIINHFIVFEGCSRYALPTATETTRMWFQVVDWWLYDTEGHRVCDMSWEEHICHE
jgi:hypothetical protein